MILGLYGSGGLGRGLYDTITRNATNMRWEHVIFINDFDGEGDYYGTDRINFNTVVQRFRSDEIEFLVAVGEPQDRQLLADKIKKHGYKLTTYIDDTAIVSPTAQIGDGVIIWSNTVIDSQAKIRSNVLIEHQCYIGHDSVVGENSVVSSNSMIGGFSYIGGTTFLGISTAVRDRIKIGDGVIVGIGSVVVRDVENDMTVVGNPAKTMKGSVPRRVWD